MRDSTARFPNPNGGWTPFIPAVDYCWIWAATRWIILDFFLGEFVEFGGQAANFSRNRVEDAP